VDNIWIALIGVIGSVITAIITSSYNIRRSLGDAVKFNQASIVTNQKMIAELSVKVDLLWEVSVRDALRAARKNELVVENSPARTTRHWREILSPRLKEKIDEQIVTALRSFQPEDTLLHVEQNLVVHFSTDLYLLSVEKNLSVWALWGALRVYLYELVEQVLEEPVQK
jgi:hypothetical protein